MTTVASNSARRAPRNWVIWGAGLVILIIGFCAALFYFITEAFKSSDAYRMGVSRLVGSSEAIAALGAPIAAGVPWGTIRVSGPDGRASLQFSATGPKGDGTVYLAATKELGTWKINRQELAVTGREGRILLDSDPNAIRTVPTQ
jgi:hypothetical protein